MVNSDQLIALMDRLDSSGVRVWIAGGWAVDAIVGRQTRFHGDVDLAVDSEHLPRLLSVLKEDNFVVTVDWSPARLELSAPDGRVVDVHPVVFADDGSGRQAGHGGETYFYAADGFTSGTIDGRTVPCLSAEQQLRFRSGYELGDVDRHDIPLLEQRR